MNPTNTETTNQTAHVLILGKHPSLSHKILGILAEAGHTGNSSNTVQGAIDLAAQEQFEVMLLGGAVTLAEEKEAVAGVRKLLPAIKVRRRDFYRDIGPVQMVQEALAERAGESK